jgi:peptide/nickel transport system ATP-binding protein
MKNDDEEKPESEGSILYGKGVSTMDVRLQTQPCVLEIVDLKKYFPVKRGLLASLRGEKDIPYIKAVDGISLSVRAGEILGLAGESGSGKTTAGKLVVHLIRATAGRITFQGMEVSQLTGAELKKFRRRVQMIFQDPYTSQNSRFTVYKWIQEPLIIHGLGDPEQQRQQVIRTLERTGLKPANQYLNTYPHQLSGGQRQRLAIARALVLEPECLVADEPTSMLDVSLRAGLIKLIRSLTVEQNLATIYISHDLSLMRYTCDRVAIMYLGKIVEIGPTESVLKNPCHPYAKALISAVPIPNPHMKRKRIMLSGEPSLAHEMISGCRFQPRCPEYGSKCKDEVPDMMTVSPGHIVACWAARRE